MPALVNQQKFFSLPAAAFSVSCFLFFLAWGGRTDFWPAEHIYEGVMLTNWLRNKGCCHITPSKADLCNTIQYNIIPSNTKQHLCIGIQYQYQETKTSVTYFHQKWIWLVPDFNPQLEFKDRAHFVFFHFSTNSSFAQISTKDNWICRWAWIVNTCFLWRPDFRPQLNQINFDFKLNSPPCLCLCLSSNWV